MKVAICDDDKNDISRLTKLLEQYDAEKHIGFTIGEYESGAKPPRASPCGGGIR